MFSIATPTLLRIIGNRKYLLTRHTHGVGFCDILSQNDQLSNDIKVDQLSTFEMLQIWSELTGKPVKSTIALILPYHFQQHNIQKRLTRIYKCYVPVLGAACFKCLGKGN